jgi:hypothetical protein
VPMESIHSTLPHRRRDSRPEAMDFYVLNYLGKKTYIRAIISSARCPLGHAAGGCEYLADGDENGKRDCESEA